MARGLKVNDWVEVITGDKRGFIIENMGNGFWGIQYVSPTVHTDVARSNQLIKLEFELDESQEKHLLKLYKDLALDTRHWDWLRELSENLYN